MGYVFRIIMVIGSNSRRSNYPQQRYDSFFIKI